MEILEIMRVIFSFILVLFIPGYALTLAIWPNHKIKVNKARLTEKRAVSEEDINSKADNELKIMGSMERVALSFCFSITIVILLGFILDKLPHGINFFSILFSLVVVSILFFKIYLYRRGR